MLNPGLRKTLPEFATSFDEEIKPLKPAHQHIAAETYNHLYDALVADSNGGPLTPTQLQALLQLFVTLLPLIISLFGGG